METANATTWLEKLEEELNVDVDWMDPVYIKSYQPFKFHDQTSNQIWVDHELGAESNRELLLQTAKELKDQGWLAIYTRMAVLMCEKTLGMISGRALLQTLPSDAYDTEKTVQHALLYDQEFARVGIGRDRYCIKIPATGPALNAANTLSAQGIATLGTAVFGLPQAIACSQARMMYISPYYNEIKAHADRTLWPNVKDPATQHPMSARITQILKAYKDLYHDTRQEQPLMKLASFLSPEEAMAAGEMGCHSATVSHQVLDILKATKYDGGAMPGKGKPKSYHVYRDGGSTPARLQKLLTTDPLAADGKLAQVASVQVDYLADGGFLLDNAIKDDPAVAARLRDALEVFCASEAASKAKIDAVLESL